MQQLELLSIENPCINVCQSNKRGYCLGCFRSRDERFNWNTFTPEEKGKILALCKQRGRRSKAKARKHNTEIPVAVITHAPDAETTDATPQTSPQASPQTMPQKKPQKKPQETVQDMGLDLFDL